MELLEPRSRYQILLSVATVVLVLLVSIHSPSAVASGTFREEHAGVGVGLEPKGSLLAEIALALWPAPTPYMRTPEEVSPRFTPRRSNHPSA